MTSSRKTGFVLTAITVAALSCTAAYWLLFGAALSQGEDNRQVHLAILKLEMSRADAVLLGGDRPRLLTANNPRSLDRYLAEDEWQQSDRYGAAIIFERNKPQETLTAICGLYSRFYLICDLSDPL